MSIKIPVYKPYLTGKEKEYVNKCIDSTWISSKGEFISKFENNFAKYTDSKFATGVCNGTVALHLALVALGINQGDEVIVPSLTYIASVNCINYCDATPIFVDSVEETWQMDVADVEKKITSKTKAILAVHLYGIPSELDKLKKICEKHNLYLIEDCAEALGTTFDNKHVGNFGDIATYSFYGNKTITTGEGGMVTTNNPTLFDRVLRLKGQGLAKNREYWHDLVGYNYRMTNICGAIGCAQLENIDFVLKRKKEIAEFYIKNLKNLPLSIHHTTNKKISNSHWMCSILVNKIEDRDLLRNHLSNKGIETRPVFYPVHTMPMYSSEYISLPICESIGWRGINLPSFPSITNEELNFICKEINYYFSNENY